MRWKSMRGTEFGYLAERDAFALSSRKVRWFSQERLKVSLAKNSRDKMQPRMVRSEQRLHSASVVEIRDREPAEYSDAEGNDRPNNGRNCDGQYKSHHDGAKKDNDQAQVNPEHLRVVV